MGFIGGGGSEILDGSITLSKLESGIVSIFDTTIKAIQENALQILINSAGASTTLNDWAEMYIERFIDTDGQLNTIDTGNTTAIFDTDKYKNLGLGSENNESHSYPPSNVFRSGTEKLGMKIIPDENIKLTKVVKNSNCNATKCYIQTAYGSGILATENFVGNTATFDQELTASTTYYILVDNDGNSYSQTNLSGASFPEDTGLIVWHRGVNQSGSDQAAYSYGIDQIYFKTYNYSDRIVQTNMESITANPIAHQVYSNFSTEGSGSITYDISFDNGSNWITNQPLDSKNNTVHEGSEMIFKMNLNGTGEGNTAEAEDYAIMLFY